METGEVVYFELNNWFPGRDYPDAEPFVTWCGNDFNLCFNDVDFVIKNKLCVVRQRIDMSVNWCVTEPKSFVLENCPKLLSDETYSTLFVRSGKDGEKKYVEEFSYNQFLRCPDDDGDVYGKFNTLFLPWSEENIGITYLEDD